MPEGTIRKVAKRQIFAAIVIWVLAMSLLVLLLSPDAPLMRAHRSNSFWLTSGIQTHYHVLNALEGTILLGVAWIIIIGYYRPDKSRNCSGGLFLRLRAIALALRGPPRISKTRHRRRS